MKTVGTIAVFVGESKTVSALLPLLANTHNEYGLMEIQLIIMQRNRVEVDGVNGAKQDKIQVEQGKQEHK